MSEMKFNYMDLVMTIVVMAEGNPGAMTAMTELLQVSRRNTPLGQWPWEMVKICDELQIYGSRLYQLWNDCLGRSTGKMAALARAYRAGRITADTIREKIRGDGCRGFAFDPEEVAGC